MAPLLHMKVFIFTFAMSCFAVRSSQANNIPGPSKRATPNPDPLGDSELLDVVLVASVDGKFHALNRTTGNTLWSMSSFASQNTVVSPPSSPAPLVRTSHIDHDPEVMDEGAYQETYIIEPQTGDIYVMATPSSPLQRFPFSMAELVDMSPFSFSSVDDHRVFFGRKQTSLLVVELETGNVKTTIDSECPWDPFEDLREGEDEVDLDELDGSKPQMSKPTEVYIGRTDYHISIHKTYGPNNQDTALQAAYRNTKDDSYIQSLPSGEIMFFKAKRDAIQAPESSILWVYQFEDPIVAVFDVMRSANQHSPHTFVLLQPRPQLSSIIPKLNHATSTDQLPHLESAYVGMVEETGSLFAMSPQQFPMVAFGGERKGVKMIGGASSEKTPIELPGEVDAITRARKEREAALQQRHYGYDDDRCQDTTSLYTDRRCLIGIRKLAGGDGDGPEMRMRRLIDGPVPNSAALQSKWGPPPSSNNPVVIPRRFVVSCMAYFLFYAISLTLLILPLIAMVCVKQKTSENMDKIM